MKPFRFSPIQDKTQLFERPDLDLIRLYDQDIDVSAFVGQKTMVENVKKQRF